MKSNELMIGNYYLSFGVDLKQVEILHKDKILIDFQPIPLTEEWLLKFGFEVTGNFQTKDRFQTHKQDGIIWFEYGYIVIELKYLHQLQNLYFALTNEELTFKS